MTTQIDRSHRRAAPRFVGGRYGEDPDDRHDVDPMKIVRRALFALWVAGVIAGAMRVRGRGGVPPQHGGWQPIDVGEG
jgi:hypothetical protein